MQAVYTDYEPTGKIGQIDYHNGTATKYTYDAWSTKLFGIVTEDPTRDPLKLLQDREYTYSRAGDILRIVDHVQKITYDYAYDKLHRLIAEKLSGTNAPIVTKVETITLDYAGFGPVHGVKQITLNGVSRTCAYDLNGNMVTSPDFTIATNPLNRAITYDADNMPTRIVHANGKTVDFVYDGVAKRTKKLVASGKTVLYLGDHFEVENGVNIKYIFGGNLRLAQIKGSLTSYFHKDHLGSTAAVTNEAGVKIESTTYEPFGSTRTQEGTPVSAYKFTDQELDNETNLYNYDARLYDPVIGMFITPDSIVPNMFDPQSLNRYSYCRNNPLVYTDPNGHKYIVENFRMSIDQAKGYFLDKLRADRQAVWGDAAKSRAGNKLIGAIIEHLIGDIPGIGDAVELAQDTFDTLDAAQNAVVNEFLGNLCLSPDMANYSLDVNINSFEIVSNTIPEMVFGSPAQIYSETVATFSVKDKDENVVIDPNTGKPMTIEINFGLKTVGYKELLNSVISRASHVMDQKEISEAISKREEHCLVEE